jgi:hypothetical protein
MPTPYTRQPKAIVDFFTVMTLLLSISTARPELRKRNAP